MIKLFLTAIIFTAIFLSGCSVEAKLKMESKSKTSDAAQSDQK